MDLVIIIGFNYNQNISNHLSSSLVDIFRVSSFARNARQIILTDCKIDNIYSKPCKLNSYWKDFFSKQEDDTCWYNIFDKEDIINCLTCHQEEIKNANKLIIYYSGHGEEEGIKLPDLEIFPYLELRNFIIGKVNLLSQILLIIDCCYPGNFGLPYSFDNDKFIINENFGRSTVVNDIICITANKGNQESTANQKYSFFTKYLFKALKQETIRFSNITDLIDGKLLIRTQQRTGIYSSHNRIPAIWPWVYGISFNIENYDYYLQLNYF